MRKISQNKLEKGFTLIELLLVVVIIGIVATIVIYSLPGERTAQALNNNEDDVVSMLNEARSRTLSGDSGKQYGVHFDAGRAVLFSGTTFVEGAGDNKEVDFDAQVTLSSITLAGSATDVVFKKLSGETDAYGTLLLNSSGSATNQKTITISKTGFISSN